MKIKNEISEAIVLFFRNSYTLPYHLNNFRLSLSQIICNPASKVSSLNLSCYQFSVDKIELVLEKLKAKFIMGPDRIIMFPNMTIEKQIN